MHEEDMHVKTLQCLLSIPLLKKHRPVVWITVSVQVPARALDSRFRDVCCNLVVQNRIVATTATEGFLLQCNDIAM